MDSGSMFIEDYDAKMAMRLKLMLQDEKKKELKRSRAYKVIETQIGRDSEIVKLQFDRNKSPSKLF